MPAAAELVEEAVALPGGELRITRPRDAESLLSEEAFAREELLPYWAELWSSSVALARVLAVRPLGGVSILELGCGLGLAAVAAARSGGRVTATDWSPPAIELTLRNAAANGVQVEALRCSWQERGVLVERAPWPLVVASDVLYDRGNIELLARLLPRLAGESSEVLIADPGRPLAQEFLDFASERWIVESHPAPGSDSVTLHRLSGLHP